MTVPLQDRDDGGAAFPRAFSSMKDKDEALALGYETVLSPPQQGMTLLDWFAGQAAQGLARAWNINENSEPTEYAAIAHHAYALARALIKERNKQL